MLELSNPLCFILAIIIVTTGEEKTNNKTNETEILGRLNICKNENINKKRIKKNKKIKRIKKNKKE